MTKMGQSLQGVQAGAGSLARVHVVDDDEDLRAALRRLLVWHGFDVRTHASAEDFLQAHDPRAIGCILLDLSMPGLDGLALQQQLARTGTVLPIIFLTGCTEVPSCAAAMRNGAVDFLTKPVDEESLLRTIHLALLRSIDRHGALLRQAMLEDRMATLTPREREVLLHIMNGRLNKQVAGTLGTSEKTVKVHRARALEKLEVRTVAEAVRLFERARGGLSPSS
jgi:FixJ family two-component response regulator